MPEDHAFKISVHPDENDPHNWCWTVSWNLGDRRRSHSGPDIWESVLPSSGAAKVSAECYADTMAQALDRAERYSYTPRTDAGRPLSDGVAAI